MGKKGSNPPPPKGVVKPPPPPNPPKPINIREDDIPTECECDNTHEANNTVCRYCWQRKNKVWRVTYYTRVMPDLTPDILSAKVRHLVAPNHTEAVLLFGRNMPEDCGHSKIDLRPLTQSELLFRKRML